MNPYVPCRIILTDHADHAPFWDQTCADLPPGALQALDARRYAFWNISPLNVVLQVGAAEGNLLDALPRLSRLRSWDSRICFGRDLGFLVILERRPKVAPDPAALRDDIESLVEVGAPQSARAGRRRDAGSSSSMTNGPSARSARACSSRTSSCSRPAPLPTPSPLPSACRSPSMCS